MQNTTNYNLKKPDYTDFADIQDINDNMDTIDEQLAAPTGDSADSTTTFTTSDTADGSASSWTTVPALTSGETHKSLFAKMSQMFKNIRYLYKMLGTTDISAIGNGTVTNALSVLNANKQKNLVLAHWEGKLTTYANSGRQATISPQQLGMSGGVIPYSCSVYTGEQTYNKFFLSHTGYITGTGIVISVYNATSAAKDLSVIVECLYSQS